MKKLSISDRIYVSLVLVLTILATINVFLPQGDFLSMKELPASKPVIALVNAMVILLLYGSLGYVGIILSRRIGFPDIWDIAVSNRQRFLFPLLTGTGIGVFFVLSDSIFSLFHGEGPIPHPPFPASLVASAAAGIGEELIFRLFFISFWIWLLSLLILKGKWKNQVFWIIAVLSALAFAAGHIPSVLQLFGMTSVNEIPSALLAEIFLLNGVLSLFAAVYLRKYGFLAAVGIHFWTDIVWHVIWGVI